MSLKLDKKVVVKTWARRGVVDFYLGFEISEKVPWYPPFFYCQGLEKICKAYLLGTKASEYEPLSEQEAKKKIDGIAKNLSKCLKQGHCLKEMIEQLISLHVLDKSVLTKKYANYGAQDITGEKIIEILEKAYTECRYPVPDSISKRYPLGRNIKWDPLASDEPIFETLN